MFYSLFFCKSCEDLKGIEPYFRELIVALLFLLVLGGDFYNS